jgi:hypothetical protein
MNFGKYAVLGAVTHHFELEPDWYWIVKPATSQDELEMAKFMSANRYYTTRDGVRHEQPANWIEIEYREIALTFGGTNIPIDPERPDSGPILNDKAKLLEIEAVLKSMPQEMVNEIWKAVGEANPTWGPGLLPRPKETGSNSTQKDGIENES